MQLSVLRYSENGESTLGLLFINGKFECYTLEDEHQDIKIKSETRIPARTYPVKLRTEGGHHQRYSNKFSDIHKGMLHIQDVPNFTHILIHIGNDDDDTAGCLLVGDSSINNINQDGRINSSTIAYKRMYSKVIEAMDKGEDVYITYYNEHNLINL
jgi:hypothetical protein